MSSCEEIFEEKYTNLIQSLNVFFEDKDNFDASEFVDDISCFIEYLRHINCDNLSGINYVSIRDLKIAVNEWDKKDFEESVCEFAGLLFHYYSLYKHIEPGNDEWAEKANMLNEYLEDYFLQKTKKSDAVHYVNLMSYDCYSDFEFVLELIHKQLRNFDTNLHYCKKIIAFLDRFYPEKIFPMDTMFLNHYLSNTVDLMILTISKLYFDAGNISTKTNCGIKYLHSFIGKNIKDKSLIQNILKQASTKIKTVTSTTGKLEVVRNKIIAHFDLDDIETAQQVRISLQELEEVYESSCEILELLSLGYFHYKNVFYNRMIKAKGFKSFICENELCHQEHGTYITDIDKYLKMLSDEFQSCFHTETPHR